MKIILNPDNTFEGPFTHELSSIEIAGRQVVELNDEQYIEIDALRPGEGQQRVWTGSRAELRETPAAMLKAMFESLSDDGQARTLGLRGRIEAALALGKPQLVKLAVEQFTPETDELRAAKTQALAALG